MLIKKLLHSLIIQIFLSIKFDAMDKFQVSSNFVKYLEKERVEREIKRIMQNKALQFFENK